MRLSLERRDLDVRDRIRGAILGGACGDALGAPVEFASRDKILATYGSRGITRFTQAYGVHGAITDDTQMTLFTVEGIIRAYVRQELRGVCHIPSVVHHAYQRWLETQDEQWQPTAGAATPDGWLITVKALWHQRAPGNTCLSALRDNTGLGDPARNNSKGCGTVMRSAPFGFLAGSVGGFDAVYGLAADSARTTHGHPTAAVASGALAVIIAHISDGQTLADAVGETLAFLEGRDQTEETRAALQGALALSRQPDWLNQLPRLGAGWIAEEALAIAVLCGLAAEDAASAVIAAANHGGDSDSTASIAGNIVGALCGVSALPAAWLDEVELRDVMETLCEDFADLVQGRFDVRNNNQRYPGF